jgi:hypothetical protein
MRNLTVFTSVATPGYRNMRIRSSLNAQLKTPVSATIIAETGAFFIRLSV